MDSTEGEFFQSELAREENRRIVSQLKTLIANSDALIEGEAHLGFEEIGKPINRRTDVDLGCYLERRTNFRSHPIFKGIPSDIKPPFYYLTIYTHDLDEKVDTPYGSLEQTIIGSDGEIYGFDDIYCFRNGQAYKVQVVGPPEAESLKEYLEKIGIEESEYRRKLRRVDFIPEDGIKVLRLTPGDYEKIGFTLRLIDEGRIKFVEAD